MEMVDEPPRAPIQHEVKGFSGVYDMDISTSNHHAGRDMLTNSKWFKRRWDAWVKC
jgi:hypothetical protein